jgi:hypothetical protein
MILHGRDPGGWKCVWSVYGAVRHAVFAPEMLRHYQKRSRGRRALFAAAEV